MSARILVIDDDPEVTRLVGQVLRSAAPSFDVEAVGSAAAGFDKLASEMFDGVLLDYRLPDIDGVACLLRIRQNHPDLPVVLLTGSGSEELAVEVMKLGASDYVVKHGKYLARVPTVLREALGRRELQRVVGRHTSTERVELGASAAGPSAAFCERLSAAGVVGASPAFAVALALAERAASSSATVLLMGESGTGKDVLARLIHEHGARGRGPYLAQNCAALPEALLESELFGHVRGAFTGADRERRGLFEEASGGTLFLDEIGETSLVLQAKLLRVLEERCVRPIGSSESRPIDVRVLAATNADLPRAVDENRFRRDLYYRLNVFPIRLPALRERGDDVVRLAAHFLERYAAEEGKAPPRLDAEALELLAAYAWPGNVRELANEMHRVVLCAEPGKRVGASGLAGAIVTAQRPIEGMGRDTHRPLREIVNDVEIAEIKSRLREHGYNRSQTARSLGITREALWAKMKQLGVAVRRRIPSTGEDEDH
jgi:DNA-binding NtrC family response regulator